MKKTVIFDFPDDFIFPKTFKVDVCMGCSLWGLKSDEEPCCFLTGDADYPLTPSSIPCPFSGGAETVVYDEIESGHNI